MTLKNGGIIGISSGIALFIFFKVVENSSYLTQSQLQIANWIFFSAQMGFVIGIGIGILRMFRNRNVLGSTTLDGIVSGLALTFDLISLTIAFTTGQSPIPK